MLSDFKNCKTMGVINVTPNSFSDPQKFFHTNELTETLVRFKDRCDLLFDFGFESTAPMNSAISALEEEGRFNQFFDQLKNEAIDLNGRWISFDTYRVESFRHFEKSLKTHYNDQRFVFNDVSGVIDDSLLSLLAEKKNDPTFKYIYSFSHIPSRDLTLKHMSYVQEGDIFKQAVDHFNSATEKFEKLGIIASIIFDPGFGFSKSFDQNWDLLNRFSELQKKFPVQQSWLVGLSKKSFLRKSLPADCPEPFLEAEKLHRELIKKIIKESSSSSSVLFRVHDFNIVQNVLKES